MDYFKIKFLPDNKDVRARRGETILACAVNAGLYINSSCGGDGVCGRCKVIIKKGNFKTQPTGRISAEEKRQGYVLACLTVVQDHLEVFIPPESRLDLAKVSDEESRFLRLKGIYSETEEVESGKPIIDEKVFAHSPLATKIFLKLPPPTLDDKISDLERLYREIRRKRDIPIMQTGLANIKRLGHILRESGWQVTATLGNRNETTEIVLIEPGDTSRKNYGVAFDIGTTTVTGQLVDLNTKKIIGTKATYNRQAVFGSDVISRIIYASEEDGLDRLHHAVIDNMNEIIKELAAERKVSLNDCMGMMVAGNTTMIHLLLRVDPTFIRRDPYVPTANFVPVVRASEAGIKINPRGLLACIPGVSTYVGGDITAGVIACGMSDAEDLTLLIDVGTNGEIALGNKEWLACCAASAGPAFEGSGVNCGMRAAKGAIQRVAIKRKDSNIEVKISAIGDERPKGICGSGYIDALAEMLKTGIINKDGKINRQTQSPRVRSGPDGYEFVLAEKSETALDKDIVITETDIENLKRSKGAIYAATLMLVKKIGVDFADIKRIYIAGGFGTYLDIEKAIIIGLLPDVPREKIVFVGNSSLVGAREILLSYETMKKAEEVARKMTYIELSVEPAYMDEYIASVFFPHTDMAKFPTVKI
ncbi:MAG: DUF4445 domain-containing protein [Candidatus Omnitrophica bacterium]|nr:DUF4445 domain-containing protein [Candidatus Omnitrophota bacterium]